MRGESESFSGDWKLNGFSGENVRSVTQKEHSLESDKIASKDQCKRGALLESAIDDWPAIWTKTVFRLIAFNQILKPTE